MADDERDAPQPTLVVRSADGRRLAVDVVGDPDPHALTVFLMHGMPGSRLGPRPRDFVLYRLGIRLVSYDRPGYGQSSRSRHRSVFDAGADVVAIANELGIEEYAVVGRSAGGPHALAVAAYAPERVTGAAVLVGSAPSDAQGLEWFEGMVDSNQEAYSAADRQVADESELVLTAVLQARANEVAENPASMITQLRGDLAPSDRRVVESPALRTLLTDTYAEAVRDGGQGWIDDALALRSNWGFKLSRVTCPVLLWHGMDDRFVPVAHTEWLADRLRETRMDADSVAVRIESGIAHFGAMEILPEALGWLSRNARRHSRR
ncbi:alpha/beta fold hydrolase [Actinospica durhamensis]|uniref:Alpha/beta fold hydrolase n=1 Tax=Actinospica durhamensis TaxID=1508375 RepID=A0A941ELB1_9ACTN|nr:alpha/beta fold hydrolase [Actinospica durhamensis]MBR7833241.1 alpha/beta fold hydrolase [Actinospica durhamensis]